MAVAPGRVAAGVEQQAGDLAAVLRQLPPAVAELAPGVRVGERGPGGQVAALQDAGQRGLGRPDLGVGGRVGPRHPQRGAEVGAAGQRQRVEEREGVGLGGGGHLEFQVPLVHPQGQAQMGVRVREGAETGQGVAQITMDAGLPGQVTGPFGGGQGDVQDRLPLLPVTAAVQVASQDPAQLPGQDVQSGLRRQAGGRGHDRALLNEPGQCRSAGCALLVARR